MEEASPSSGDDQAQPAPRRDNRPRPYTSGSARSRRWRKPACKRRTGTSAASSPPSSRAAWRWPRPAAEACARTCAWPLVQRACCARQAAAVCGNSPGTIRSGIIAARQPCIMQRMERSRSSVSVSPVQPPPCSMAVRFHTPAVPLKEMRQAGAEARFLLHREMGIQQQALHPRQPVGVAVGMAPARLHKGKAADRPAAPARCGAGNRAAARNRHRRSPHRAHRNGLRPKARLPALKPVRLPRRRMCEIHAFRHHARIASRASVVMAVAVAVIEQLDGEAVARPVHARRRLAATRTASGPSLQTGSCTSTCGKLVVASSASVELRAFAEDAHPGQHRQLDRQACRRQQGRRKGRIAGVRERPCMANVQAPKA